MKSLGMIRYRNLYGTRFVRRSCYHSIHNDGPPTSPSWFYYASFVLFHSPRTQLDRLRLLIVDGIVKEETMKHHIEMWAVEWNTNLIVVREPFRTS